MGAWWVTARALPRNVENRKGVQIPPSSCRTTGVPLWCELPYCCTAVVDWSVRTAPLLLYRCGGGLVGGWTRVVGAWWVTVRALPRNVENRQKVQIPPSSWHTKGVPLWCVLLYCCAAFVAWSVCTAPLLLYYCGRGLVGGWWVGGGGAQGGRTCSIVRGCVFVPVGDGPVILFKRIIPHYFHCCTAFHFVCVFVPVGDGPNILCFIQPAAAIYFPPLYRPALSYFMQEYH